MTDNHDPMALQADAEALDWIVALQEAPDDDDVRARFNAWHGASTLNAAAWNETAQVYAGIGETEPVHSERWTHLRRHARSGSPWNAFAQPLRRRSTAQHRHPRRRLPVGLALSAAAAAALAIMISPELAIRWQANAIAGTGEVKALALEDGSHAYLAPGSAIKIAFSKEARRLTLLKGTVWFDVKHETDRPFQVAAGDVTTTDIGTAFEISMATDQVHVAVADGIVHVDRDLPGNRVSERLTAGQAISIGPAAAAALQPTPAALIGSWRDGQLAVQDQPMSEVVARLRPWYQGVILIRSDRLARRRVTGIYDLRHPAEAMRALAKAYGGNVAQITPWILVLSESP